MWRRRGCGACVGESRGIKGRGTPYRGGGGGAGDVKILVFASIVLAVSWLGNL